MVNSFLSYDPYSAPDVGFLSVPLALNVPAAPAEPPTAHMAPPAANPPELSTPIPENCATEGPLAPDALDVTPDSEPVINTETPRRSNSPAPGPYRSPTPVALTPGSTPEMRYATLEALAEHLGIQLGRPRTPEPLVGSPPPSPVERVRLSQRRRSTTTSRTSLSSLLLEPWWLRPRKAALPLKNTFLRHRGSELRPARHLKFLCYN